jgi:glutamine amidotransferase-like uncharacterized protein
MNNDPNYAEFDDCIWVSLYCSSKKARAEIIRLKTLNGLGFLFNPGGGQFVGHEPYFNCQITTFDDVLDLTTLRKALTAAGRSTE